MIEIPNNRQYVQTNKSDIFGNLVASFNLVLTKVLGKLRISRTIQTTSQSSVSTLTSYPVGFAVFNDGVSAKIWTVVGLSGVGKPHVSATAVPNASFIVDATASTPADCDSVFSDIITFGAGTATPKLYVMANSKLYQNSAGTWSSTSSNLSGGGPWSMTTYANRLYIAISGLGKITSTSDGSTIPATGNTYTLDLLGARITFIRAASNRIWIGTVSSGGKGYIHEWDGVSQQVTRSYRLESQGALACVIKDDTPWIMDSNGKLCVYSNGTFVEVAQLPLSEKSLYRATDAQNDRFIHPNGMSVINGKINMLINNLLGGNAGSIPEFCPSGIWEYDEKIGLYHKHSFSYLPLNLNTITDYGQNRLSGVGGLSDMKNYSGSIDGTNATGDFVAGAVVYTDASSTDAGIFTNDTFTGVTGTYHATQGYGHFVTAKIEASQIDETFQRLWLFFKQLPVSTDQITAKYRTTEADPTEISITWASTTTFTTLTDLRSYVGYEVEITQGTGGGKTAHITKVDVTGSTYTITLDDSFTGVTTGTAKARIQNWTKFGNLTNDTTSQFFSMSIDRVSSWMQLKVCFQFTGPAEFSKALLISKPHQLAE